MRPLWAPAGLATALLLTGCSSSSPSQAAVKSEQAHFCQMVTQWIRQNENVTNVSMSDGAANMELAVQLDTSARKLVKWGAYYGDDIEPTDSIVPMTQWESNYRDAVDNLRLYCNDAGIQVPQWGQA